MDRQEPVVKLGSGGFEIVSLDWYRRVEEGSVRWWIAGFVHLSFSIYSLIHFIAVQWLFGW